MPPSPSPPDPARQPLLARLDALTDLAHRCHALVAQTLSSVERGLPGVRWGEAVRDGGRLEPVRRAELAQDV